MSNVVKINGEREVVIFKYLGQFKSNFFALRLERKFTGYSLFEHHIEEAIQVLQDFCQENYFNIKKMNIRGKSRASIAENNWLIYHLAQSRDHLSSFLIVLEVANIIHYYKSNSLLHPIAEGKLKSKNGIISEGHFTNSILELYVGIRLRKLGYEVKQDINQIYGNQNKPIDLYAKINNVDYLIECTRLKQARWIDASLTTFFDTMSTPTFWGSKTDFKNLTKEQMSWCGYVKFGKSNVSENRINELKNRLYEKLKNLNVKMEESIAYSDDEMIIERFQEGLYKSYPEILKGQGLTLSFRIIPKIEKDHINFTLQSCLNLNSIDWTAKIKKALEKKQNQHKQSEIIRKIYIMEIENIFGLSLPFNINEIDLSRICGKLKSEETLILIQKESRNNVIERTIKSCGNDLSNLSEFIQSLKANPTFDFGKRTTLVSF